MLIITCICWSVQIIVNVSDNLLVYYFYLAPSDVLVMSAFIFMAHSLQDNFVAGGSNQLSSFRMWFSSPQKFEHAWMNVDLCQSKSVYIILRSSFQVYYYIITLPMRSKWVFWSLFSILVNYTLWSLSEKHWKKLTSHQLRRRNTLPLFI